MTHPDKGTEMFRYELSVDEPFRRKRYGTELVKALAHTARTHHCYGMWVLTGGDNRAALATYRPAGGVRESTNVMLSWGSTGDFARRPSVTRRALHRRRRSALGGPTATLRDPVGDPPARPYPYPGSPHGCSRHPS